MKTIHYRSVATAALASIMSFVAATVQGSEIKVLADSPLQPALTKVAELFEQETRDRILLTFDPSPAVKKRIEQGERADVVIVQPDFVEELTSSGKVRSGDRPIIGKVGVGLGNRRDDEERPQALIGILAGENRGKRMVRLVFAPTAFTLTPRPPT
jgi:molybdate transport system substrate-binding protein